MSAIVFIFHMNIPFNKMFVGTVSDFFSVALYFKFTQFVRIYIFTDDNKNKKCIEVITAAQMT